MSSQRPSKEGHLIQGRALKQALRARLNPQDDGSNTGLLKAIALVDAFLRNKDEAADFLQLKHDVRHALTRVSLAQMPSAQGHCHDYLSLLLLATKHEHMRSACRAQQQNHREQAAWSRLENMGSSCTVQPHSKRVKEAQLTVLFLS
jgi:hypothetical protein